MRPKLFPDGTFHPDPDRFGTTSWNRPLARYYYEISDLHFIPADVFPPPGGLGDLHGLAEEVPTFQDHAGAIGSSERVRHDQGRHNTLDHLPAHQVPITDLQEG